MVVWIHPLGALAFKREVSRFRFWSLGGPLGRGKYIVILYVALRYWSAIASKLTSIISLLLSILYHIHDFHPFLPAVSKRGV